ncbi:aminoacyl-tRNA hydrolase [Marinicella rhabdoformis]|uniref:aminoacyl-tRNA hydrolase n=1 Tax=Marinicella rhabdoformis TaxID=2580566 RepID=UPI001C555377|nr:aminoacyl-tRNA hydrolase [Marinicella rhabdoformis]
MKVIFGLGNPGSKYEATRHNAGFWFLDALAEKFSVAFKLDKKFKADVAVINHLGHKIWLVKPQTFMNCSGQSVVPFCHFYRIDAPDALVAYDELDLPVGIARIKLSGGHGGHNGLRDIIPGLGKDFVRLRLGIGRPERKGDVTPWVLGKPPREDAILLDRCLDECLDVFDLMVEKQWPKAMNALHTDS